MSDTTDFVLVQIEGWPEVESVELKYITLDGKCKIALMVGLQLAFCRRRDAYRDFRNRRQSRPQRGMGELEWEPNVNAAHAGVTASTAVVSLRGHVDTYTEKLAAERAVERVVGVKAVAEELEVYSPSDTPDFKDIAKSAVQALSDDRQH
jgi:hypothetical protein